MHFPLNVNNADYVLGKARTCAVVLSKIAELVIFVFFAHKEYSRSFAKLKLSHSCHMDCFIDVLTFQDISVPLLSMQAQISKISSFVFRR